MSSPLLAQEAPAPFKSGTVFVLEHASLDKLFAGAQPHWGSHTIHLRETNMFGQVHWSYRVVRLT